MHQRNNTAFLNVMEKKEEKNTENSLVPIVLQLYYGRYQVRKIYTRRMNELFYK